MQSHNLKTSEDNNHPHHKNKAKKHKESSPNSLVKHLSQTFHKKPYFLILCSLSVLLLISAILLPILLVGKKNNNPNPPSPPTPVLPNITGISIDESLHSSVFTINWSKQTQTSDLTISADQTITNVAWSLTNITGTNFDDSKISIASTALTTAQITLNCGSSGLDVGNYSYTIHTMVSADDYQDTAYDQVVNFSIELNQFTASLSGTQPANNMFFVPTYTSTSWQPTFTCSPNNVGETVVWSLTNVSSEIASIISIDANTGEITLIAGFPTIGAFTYIVSVTLTAATYQTDTINSTTNTLNFQTSPVLQITNFDINNSSLLSNDLVAGYSAITWSPTITLNYDLTAVSGCTCDCTFEYQGSWGSNTMSDTYATTGQLTTLSITIPSGLNAGTYGFALKLTQHAPNYVEISNERYPTTGFYTFTVVDQFPTPTVSGISDKQFYSNYANGVVLAQPVVGSSVTGYSVTWSKTNISSTDFDNKLTFNNTNGNLSLQSGLTVGTYTYKLEAVFSAAGYNSYTYTSPLITVTINGLLVHPTVNISDNTPTTIYCTDTGIISWQPSFTLTPNPVSHQPSSVTLTVTSSISSYLSTTGSYLTNNWTIRLDDPSSLPGVSSSMAADITFTYKINYTFNWPSESGYPDYSDLTSDINIVVHKLNTPTVTINTTSTAPTGRVYNDPDFSWNPTITYTTSHTISSWNIQIVEVTNFNGYFVSSNNNNPSTFQLTIKQGCTANNGNPLLYKIRYTIQFAPSEHCPNYTVDSPEFSVSIAKLTPSINNITVPWDGTTVTISGGVQTVAIPWSIGVLNVPGASINAQAIGQDSFSLDWCYNHPDSPHPNVTVNTDTGDPTFAWKILLEKNNPSTWLPGTLTFLIQITINSSAINNISSITFLSIDFTLILV